MNGNLKDTNIQVTIKDTSLKKTKYYWTNDPTGHKPVELNMKEFTGNTIELPKTDGIYYLWIYALDSVDLYTYQQSGRFIYDTTPPAPPTIIVKENGKDLAISDGSYVHPTAELEILPGTDNISENVKIVDLEISQNGTNITTDVTTNGTKYEFTTDATYTVKAKSEDEAGNRSTLAQFTFTVDSSVPDEPQVALKGVTSGNSHLNDSIVNEYIRIDIEPKVDQTTKMTIYKNDKDVTSEFSNNIINESGKYTIEFQTYLDKKEDFIVKTKINITIDLEKPVADSTIYNVVQDDELLIVFSATDENGIEGYEYTEPTHGTLTQDDDGNYIYTPTAGYIGEDSITYTATDKAGNKSEKATITINVVNKLVESFFVSESEKTIQLKQNGTYTFRFPLEDSNGLKLIYEIELNATHGTLELNSSNGTFTYTPSSNYTGMDVFSIEATNGLEDVVIEFEVHVEKVASSGSHSGGGGGRRRWRFNR